MELKLDESSVNILQNIFDWTDVDGDGKISREDIFKSLGLPSEEDAEQFFNSLKDLAGVESATQFLTFEEYCKGIMDYPSLINQFCQDFHREPSTSVQSYEDSENSSVRKSEIDFLPSKLKIATALYNKVLKQTIPELESTFTEDLLEALRTCLEGLKHKSKSEPLPAVEILNGSIELYLLVRDLSRLNEKLISEKNFEISELQSQLFSLNKKYDRVLEENDKLIININQLEQTHENISRAQRFAFEEKQKLELELAKAEEKETDFNTYIQQIKSVIVEKEKEIVKMEKEIRQLNSLKTLQELKVSAALQTDEVKNQRMAQIRLRQSVQVKNKSSIEPHEAALNNDLKVIFSNQLKKKSEIFQIRVNYLDEQAFKIQKLEQEILALKEDNERLNQRVKRMSRYEHLNTDDRESNLFPSLYDEFLMVKGGSEGEFRGSVVYHFKTTPMIDAFCQAETETLLIKPESKDRECCLWFR